MIAKKSRQETTSHSAAATEEKSGVTRIILCERQLGVLLDRNENYISYLTATRIVLFFGQMWRWIEHHTTIWTIGQVEILVNEPYSNGPGPANDGNGCGQFTHKVYHIGRYKVLQAVNAMNLYFSLVTSVDSSLKRAKFWFYGLNIILSIFAFVFTWLKFSIWLLAYDQS